jgi:heparin binding hemagglutinin HbhA
VITTYRPEETTMSDTKYPRPFYAAAGVGDLAAEQLRRLPERVAGLQEWARAEFAGSGGKARTELAQLGGRLGDRLGSGLAQARTRAGHVGETLGDVDVRADLKRISDAARRRAGEFSVTAQRNLVTAQVRATELYDGLVSRGETLIEGVVDQPETKELTEATEQVKRSTKATATSARKAAGTAKKAAKATGDKVG